MGYHLSDSVSVSTFKCRNIINLICTFSLFLIFWTASASPATGQTPPPPPVVTDMGSTDDGSGNSNSSGGGGGTVVPDPSTYPVVIDMGSTDDSPGNSNGGGGNEPNPNDPVVLDMGSTDDGSGNGSGGQVWIYGVAANLAIAGATLDERGDIYLAGSFHGQLKLHGETFVSEGGQDALLVKYDSDGSYQWAKRSGGLDHDEALAIVAAPWGEIILAGRFSDQARFDNHGFTSLGARDVFLAGVSPAGDIRWARNIGGEGDDIFNRLRVTGDELIVLEGAFRHKRSFGMGELLQEVEAQPFRMHYDSWGRLARISMEEADFGE